MKKPARPTLGAKLVMGKPAGSSLSPFEHTAIGAFAGVVEVCIMQPTVAIKNALQEGRSLPANPAQYYRGVVVKYLDTLVWLVFTPRHRLDSCLYRSMLVPLLP